MSDDPRLLAFPDLSDEAVIALHDLLEMVTICFENRYFTQLRRIYYTPPSTFHADQQILPFDDPPF